MPEED
jgi:hypothetical protein